jgi:hypothetical protein
VEFAKSFKKGAGRRAMAPLSLIDLGAVECTDVPRETIAWIASIHA